MARPIDSEKIERVKNEAVKLITTKGFAATSIENVAKKAEVATGYLYRHYPSKLALVQSIYEDYMKRFHDRILNDLKSASRVEEVVSGLVDFLHDVVREHPQIFDFMFLMLHDHTFQFPRRRIDTIRDICKQIHKLGRKTGEISPDYDAEAIFFTFFSIPLKFFDSRQRGIFMEKAIDEKDIRKLKRICLSALQA